MPSDETNPETGKTLRTIGSYRLLQQLGTGGMSSVFRAAHLQTGAEVAVKILPKQLAQNPTLLQRFLNEAKNAERLEHPNIVSIYDRGFDQGRHYLVLEYVSGGDLQDRVRDQGPLGVSEGVSVIRQIAEALKYAASRGVIHRDIKPANLLLGPGGAAKVIDLGLAVETEAEDERVTREGTTVGTVDYMAPEQARNSRATSEASDIYSLGCTFHYLMTGSPPYPGGDIVEKLGRHCTAPIPDIREKRPEAPESLALLIKRMMAKKPIQRFQNHGELIAALKALELEPRRPMALFVDDMEEIGLMPGSDEFDGPAPAASPSPKHRLAASAAARGPASASTPLVTPPSLRDLGALASSDDEPAARRPASKGKPAPVAVMMAEFVDEEFDEEDDYAAPAPAVRRSSGPNFFEKTTSLKTFIGVGVAIGLAIALVGVAIIQLILVLADTETQTASQASRPEETRSAEPVEEPPVRVAPAGPQPSF